MSCPERRWRLAVLGIVLFVAVAVRLVGQLQLAHSPWALALVGDEEAYDARARAVAGGDLALGRRPYYQDPLYPYLVGVLYAGFGPRPWLVRAVQAALGALAAALVAGLAARRDGPLAGLVAGLLVAVSTSLRFYEGQVEKTAPTVVLTAAALALAQAAARPERGARTALAAGATFGSLALLRGNFLLLLPVVLGWGLLALPRRRALALAAGTALAVLPATARNLAVSGELVLVTSQGGQNFYLGNWQGSERGDYVPPPFVRPHAFHEEADFAREAERRLGRPLGARELSRYWLGEGLAAVRADPRRFARNVLRRLTLALHPSDVPDNLDLGFVARFVPALAWPLPDFALAAALGLPGLALGLARRDRVGALVPLVTVGYLATLLPFFVFGRYRLPLLVPLALGAGRFAALLSGWAGAGHWRRCGLAGLAAAGLWVGLQALPPVDPHEAQSYNTLGTVRERGGDPAGALAAYEAGLAGDDRHPLLRFNRARLLVLAGRREEAAGDYRLAIESLPTFAEARANLGALLLEGGDLDAAEAELAAALALDPGLTPAAFNLAAVAEGRGEAGLAARRYRAAARLAGPSSPLAAEALRRAVRLESGER